MDEVQLICLVNQLVREHFLVYLEEKDDGIYFLRDHWKYLKPKRQAPRELVGHGKLNLGQYVYLTKTIPILRRTKF